MHTGSMKHFKTSILNRSLVIWLFQLYFFDEMIVNGIKSKSYHIHVPLHYENPTSIFSLHASMDTFLIFYFNKSVLPLMQVNLSSLQTQVFMVHKRLIRNTTACKAQILWPLCICSFCIIKGVTIVLISNK